jgi:uncharacterized delta-60 repeat protein
MGGSQRNNLQTTAVLAARLNADGKADSTFGGNAGIPGLYVQQYAQGAGYSAAYGVAVDSAGKIVLAGSAIVSSTGANALAVRLTTKGAPDRAFSGDGAVYLPASTSKDTFSNQEPFPGAGGVVISGGDIVLGGYFDNLGVKRPAVWGLGSSGATDTAFGDGGRTVTDLGGGLSGELADIALGAGPIYGVGATSSLFEPTKGLAVRYDGKPVPVDVTITAKSSYPLGPSLRKGIPITAACNQACTLAATLKAAGSVVAKASGKLKSAGRKVLKLRFTAAGKRKLAGRKRVAGKITVTAKAGGKTDKASKGIVLKG